MAQSNLNMEIQFLPGVGPKRASLLQKELNISTVEDLLKLYPFRYIDKSSFTRICDARPDMAYVQIRAKVLRVDLFGNGQQPMSAMGTAGVAHAQTEGSSQAPKFNTIKRMSAWVSDGSGELEMVFFKGI